MTFISDAEFKCSTWDKGIIQPEVNTKLNTSITDKIVIIGVPCFLQHLIRCMQINNI